MYNKDKYNAFIFSMVSTYKTKSNIIGPKNITSTAHLCMFQHEENEESEDEDNNEDDDHVNDDDVNESREEENVMSIDDIEPSLRKVEEAMEKVNELLKQQKLKWDVCEFQARNANGLNAKKPKAYWQKQKVSKLFVFHFVFIVYLNMHHIV